MHEVDDLFLKLQPRLVRLHACQLDIFAAEYRAGQDYVKKMGAPQ